MKRKTPLKAKKGLKAKKPMPKKAKPKSLGYWKRKVDAVFSEYIRRKGADREGMNSCFTCGVRKHWKELQNGHYIRRSAGNAVYFLEPNCHPQCYACNIWRDGNSDVYALKLIEKYGPEILHDLAKMKAVTVQYRASDYQTLLEEYKAKLMSL